MLPTTKLSFLTLCLSPVKFETSDMKITK